MAAVGIERDGVPNTRYHFELSVPECADHTPMPSTIGRYEVVRPLGEGGMGRVFLARDPNVDRQVAIKLLRRGFESPDFQKRFWREARAAGGLRHKNVVTIFDIDEMDGLPFIVMEYIPGRTLAEVISRREPLLLEQRLSMIEGLCAGLACAHAAGVVHRDIKPANVIVDSDDVVKILDFGVAKPAERAGTPATQLTAEQVLIGTIGYIAPEHLSGSSVDFRCDMFAAGAVAYELLTFGKPFGDVAAFASRRALTGDVTPMSTFTTDVPASVERIVLTALSVLPQDRYRDMATMQRLFAETREELIVAGVQTVGDISISSQRHPAVRAGAFAASLAVVAMGLWLTGRTPGEPQGSTSAPNNQVAAKSPKPAEPLVNETRGSTLRPSSPGAPAAYSPREAGSRNNRATGNDSAVSRPTEPIAAGPPIQSSVSPPNASQAPLTGNTAPAPVLQESAALENPAPTVPHLSQEDQSGIQRTLRAFEEAIANQSTAGLRKIQPTLTQAEMSIYDHSFTDSQSYVVRLSSERVYPESPTRVRVECLIEREVSPIGGAPRRRSGRAEFVLEKGAEGWVINGFRRPDWW